MSFIEDLKNLAAKHKDLPTVVTEKEQRKRELRLRESERQKKIDGLLNGNQRIVVTVLEEVNSTYLNNRGRLDFNVMYESATTHGEEVEIRTNLTWDKKRDIYNQIFVGLGTKHVAVQDLNTNTGISTGNLDWEQEFRQKILDVIKNRKYVNDTTVRAKNHYEDAIYW